MCEVVVRSHNSSCRSSPTEATCKKTPDELGTFEYSRYNLKVKSEHPPDKGRVFDVNGAIAAQLLTTCECCCQWWRWATQLFTMSPQKLFARRDIVDRIVVPVIDDEASFCDESCKSQPRCLLVFFFEGKYLCLPVSGSLLLSKMDWWLDFRMFYLPQEGRNAGEMSRWRWLGDGCRCCERESVGKPRPSPRAYLPHAGGMSHAARGVWHVTGSIPTVPSSLNTCFVSPYLSYDCILRVLIYCKADDVLTTTTSA